MRIKSVTEWTLMNGSRRKIRLYRAWVNMKARARGTNYAGNGFKAWADVPVLFFSWAHFREWSLSHGYSRINNSLDRYPDAYGPYSENNCRWVTVSENTSWQNLRKFLRDKEAEDYDDTYISPQVGALRCRQSTKFIERG